MLDCVEVPFMESSIVKVVASNIVASQNEQIMRVVFQSIDSCYPHYSVVTLSESENAICLFAKDLTAKVELG